MHHLHPEIRVRNLDVDVQPAHRAAETNHPKVIDDFRVARLSRRALIFGFREWVRSRGDDADVVIATYLSESGPEAQKVFSGALAGIHRQSGNLDLGLQELVHESLAEFFAGRFHERLRKLSLDRPGSPIDDEVLLLNSDAETVHLSFS